MGMTDQDIVIRLLCAMLCGFVLGLDRDIKKKSIDFRAYMIVAAAGALSVMIILEMIRILPADLETLQIDPSRAVQGVLLGIAFLGSATIIRKDDRIEGTATGATIWIAGVIGVAFGCGLFVLGFAGFACVFIILMFIPRVLPQMIAGRDDR